ncbi:MAG: alpha-1,4-glucan--maltose-1-phosphate maltosyltransferase [Candidatus Kuenenia sp.]|uniref:alpha-1,4-glucan--maltose-1-phosphate maltosyltransferase n=1 Tax=Candidatus Kuenenia sp. TaxID=2499824 RepID=UPI0022CACC12|nr:alpha-1,4-glucan--maltose-1-phosphate maltosyltransferase [Candidatus Kuenenia sp.]MCZ7623711.1 alpha-1,4-glucan--maltose-1-phosphate maltosyltransferase [Candidatus Kuenenia sp.]
MEFEGRKRVIIENVRPQIDCGRFPVKRVIGEKVVVQADVFTDGHDDVIPVLLQRKASEKVWLEIPMKTLGNDRWEGNFTVREIGIYYYTVEGWVDHFTTWKKELKKKYDAGQEISMDILTGVVYIQKSSALATKDDSKKLHVFANTLKTEKNTAGALSLAFNEELASLMKTWPDKSLSTLYEKELGVVVDREKALFSAWYELFPRSCNSEQERGGTLKDCESLIPEIANMGFNILYLPPIHPIGITNRKGKNNSPVSQKGEPGSPWAIGSHEGGHTSIHPSLGTEKDFQALIERAREYNIDIALDLAFQCSPDHPYIKKHRNWFKIRPDGSIQHAENPPKKYEDIVPFNFETENWKGLWHELKNVVFCWIERGVRIFRVDNPHTKPFAFWEWLIGETQKIYPEVIFLSEAFTRPKVMYRLAKIGFTQSYTYFTWRNTKRELTQYVTELTQEELKEYFRPNFWPNTPDILPEQLQYGRRPAFIIRFILASTLSSNYGIYGPAFELCVSEAVTGKEEYFNSEKYEIKQWNLNMPGNLKDLITRINRIRIENAALQDTGNIRFYEVDNEHLLFYGKTTEDLSNIILVVVNLDPHHAQSGWVNVPIKILGIDANQSYMVHDLLSDEKYVWQGKKNYVELQPDATPAHIFRIRKRLRKETDFDYYM